MTQFDTGERVRSRKGGPGTVLDSTPPKSSEDEIVVLVAFDTGVTRAVYAHRLEPLFEEVRT